MEGEGVATMLCWDNWDNEAVLLGTDQRVTALVSNADYVRRVWG